MTLEHLEQDVRSITKMLRDKESCAPPVHTGSANALLYALKQQYFDMLARHAILLSPVKFAKL